MTTKQRRQYLVLHAVRELVRAMAEHGTDYERKTRKALDRIEGRVSGMLDALGRLTAADSRYFIVAAHNLRTAWTSPDGDRYTPAAYVAIALTLVADQFSAIPPRAEHARREFATLEGMIATLYQHFDPEMQDNAASEAGERVAEQYRHLTAA